MVLHASAFVIRNTQLQLSQHPMDSISSVECVKVSRGFGETPTDVVFPVDMLDLVYNTSRRVTITTSSNRPHIANRKCQTSIPPAVLLLQPPCSPTALSSSLPLTRPDKCPAPPLRTRFLLPRWPQRPTTHPKLASAIDARFLRREAYARLIVAVAPGRRLLGE